MPDVELQADPFQSGSHRHPCEMAKQNSRRDVGQRSGSDMHGLYPRSGSEAEGLREEADEESRIIHQRSSAREDPCCTPCPLLRSHPEGLPRLLGLPRW